jgi:hypothetical protein
MRAAPPLRLQPCDRVPRGGEKEGVWGRDIIPPVLSLVIPQHHGHSPCSNPPTSIFLQQSSAPRMEVADAPEWETGSFTHSVLIRRARVCCFKTGAFEADVGSPRRGVGVKQGKKHLSSRLVGCLQTQLPKVPSEIHSPWTDLISPWDQNQMFLEIRRKVENFQLSGQHEVP